MADHSSHAAQTYPTPCETVAGNSAETPLRAQARRHLRRQRHTRGRKLAAQPDLFTAGCDTHGTPTGRECALCLDQLELPFDGDGA